MSQAVRVAVATLLTGDAGLKTLLAPHPLNPALPAVFNATKRQAPPVYDCLTYRVSQSVPDARFEPPIPGTGDSDVEDVYIDFEAWTDQLDSAPIEAVGERLKALFGNTAFDAPPDGRVFKSHRTLAQTDLYDDKLNCWFGLFRFRLRLQRGAVSVLEVDVAEQGYPEAQDAGSTDQPEQGYPEAADVA